MRGFASLLIACTALSVGACAPAPLRAALPVAGSAGASSMAYARVVAPGAVPAAIAATAAARAQAEADAASERRDIDHFALPEAPLGIAIGTGERQAWVLGFLGTGRTDADLNIELRALVAGDDVGVTFNYSGPTTLGRLPVPGARPLGARRSQGPTFELLMGLPGNGVADAYGDYMTGLAAHLERRHQARPFAFDDVPLVFAVHEGGAPTGFVFTNQGNRLVLGDRKYADVQSVVCLTAEARVAAAYTVIAFNRKTAGPAAAPAWSLERDARFGTLASCGER